MSELFDPRTPRPTRRRPQSDAAREANRRAFAEVWEALEREALRPAQRTPRSPEKDREYRERARVRRRLQSLGKRIDALAAELERIHSDRAGWFHFMPLPLYDAEWRGSARAPGIGPAFERAKRDAECGCEISASFVREYEAAVLLCERRRHTRPPRRAPDWRPHMPDGQNR